MLNTKLNIQIKSTIIKYKYKQYLYNYLNLELKEIKNICNDAKYVKINLEKSANAFNNFRNDKINKNKEILIMNYKRNK